MNNKLVISGLGFIVLMVIANLSVQVVQISRGSNSDNLASAGSVTTLTTSPTIASTIKVQTNHNPSLFGAVVTFTATLSSNATTGNVTFFDNGIVLGTASISSGKAVFSTSALSIGTHPISANYTGDATYFPSSSEVISQVVNPNTSIKVQSSKNPGIYGTPIKFTATLSNNAATGLVTFYDGTDVLGTVGIVSGKAVLSASSLSIGSHPVTASYDGSGSFNASVSPVLVENINSPGSFTLTMTPSTASVPVGSAAQFTVMVTPANGFVGTVTLNLTGMTGVVSPTTISVSGTATVLIPTTGTGSFTPKVTGVSGTITKSDSSKLTVLTSDASAPTTVITSPQNGQTFTGALSVTATASDDIGVTRVELWKDGALVATDTSSPYSFSQDVTTQSTKTVTFQTKAYDAVNNSGSSDVVSITAVPVSTSAISADKVLVVFNTNSPDSVAVKDYYLANRPEFSTANVLGVTTDDVEVTSLSSFQTTIRQPIVDWLQENQTKPIYYIVLLRGIPDRISGGASVDYQMSTALSDIRIKTGVQYGGNTGLAYIPSRYPGTTALVTHLNMGSLEATTAYIDKLKAVHDAMATPNVIISGQAAGKAGTNYELDEAQGYASWPLIQYSQNALTSAGVPSSRITYTSQTSSTHITQASDVLGYETWGANGGIGGDYANNGTVTFSGSSAWYLIKTIESYNGQWNASQGNFIDWFSANAFGGTNYSNTPAGGTTQVEEPYATGVAGRSYLADWEKGLLFAEAAWDSRQTPYFMAVGDPLITR